MIDVPLPRLSLSMEDGKIARWLVPHGTEVTAGQPIVEIETDKAVTEVESPATGTIHLLAQEGAVVPVEALLARIADKSVEDRGATGESEPSPAGRHRASPAARRVARENGIELPRASGSGPGGRIMVRDLKAITPRREKPQLREAVVAQLAASWREIPHIHIGGELDGSGLAAAKRSAPAGVTLTDLLILAIGRALAEVPELNGVLGKPSPHIHLALAVAAPGGVISPVIRDVQARSLAEIASERARLVTAARAGTTSPRDLAGGTITVTNLGAYPVDFFAPIVSGPQIAMLAIGRLAERAVVINGAIVVRHRIWMDVAIDHRGADGVVGGRFLAALEHCLSSLGN